MEKQMPKIWVWVIVRRNWKVLLWKRKNAHWEWTWAFPWWHLEMFEKVEDCAKRETYEESWLEVTNINIWPYTNDFFEQENKHYITLVVICDSEEWEPIVKEPHKLEYWDWFERDKLPSPLFIPINNLVDSWFNPFNK